MSFSNFRTLDLQKSRHGSSIIKTSCQLCSTKVDAQYMINYDFGRNKLTILATVDVRAATLANLSTIFLNSARRVRQRVARVRLRQVRARVLQYYNFTAFAMTLNELDAQSTLPPTDCRFRPDVRTLENGDIGKRRNRRYQTLPPVRCCPLVVTVLNPSDSLLSHYRVAHSWSSCANMMSSIKPDVHNVSQRRQRRTEPPAI